MQVALEVRLPQQNDKLHYPALRRSPDPKVGGSNPLRHAIYNPLLSNKNNDLRAKPLTRQVTRFYPLRPVFTCKTDVEAETPDLSSDPPIGFGLEKERVLGARARNYD